MYAQLFRLSELTNVKMAVYAREAFMDFFEKPETIEYMERREARAARIKQQSKD